MGEKEASCFKELTDEELVKLSQEGDNLALDTLARRFLSRKPKMYNAGYLDVDDLLQEGMISFLSAVRTYKQEKGIPFSAYATVCMNNGVVSAVRKTKNDFQLDYEVDPVTVGGEVKNPLDTIVDSENLSSVLSLCESVLSDVEKSVVYSQMSGLSYTEFEICDVKAEEKSGQIVVSCKVTNSGTVAGKEVVQVYYSAPQGKLGKSARELAGFKKTKLLNPGETEEVTISFEISSLVR